MIKFRLNFQCKTPADVPLSGRPSEGKLSIRLELTRRDKHALTGEHSSFTARYRVSATSMSKHEIHTAKYNNTAIYWRILHEFQRVYNGLDVKCLDSWVGPNKAGLGWNKQLFKSHIIRTNSVKL